MRLWSISPIYLDSVGLVALWREALLAQKVLCGLSKGYINHPQLNRFRAVGDPITAIGCYLSEVEREARCRGYKFDASKIMCNKKYPKMPVYKGQIAYEWQHFMKKVEIRTPDLHRKNREIVNPEAHASFEVVSGKIEDWERIQPLSSLHPG